MRIHWRFAKNAVANLGRGGAAAIVAVLLPPLLVRHMTPAAYAVWVLVLETAAYVGYLNFGLQTAIGRYVAYANERRDRQQRDAVFSTALVGLCAAALLALIFLAVAVFAAPKIFPGVPLKLVPQMRLALLLVGTSLAVGLPASSCNGVFIGIERYELPAMTVGGGRLLSALGLVAPRWPAARWWRWRRSWPASTCSPIWRSIWCCAASSPTSAFSQSWCAARWLASSTATARG